MSEDSGQQADQVLDLSDEVCPYTFVKSKLALQGLDSGQVLQVHVGNSESASNVPRSMESEGHEVLSVEQTGQSQWVVTIRRG
jgi:TusA-related sulfurtransferase